MKEAKSFASSLARSLGPLYRIVLLGVDGIEIASYGSFSRGTAVGKSIELPGAKAAIRIEIDFRRIQAADEALHTLAAGSTLEGLTLGAFSHLDDALEQLIRQGEAHIGRPLDQMSRSEKQQLVRFLDERGAFALRKSVERLAETLGVSRFTVYNYLDSVRRA